MKQIALSAFLFVVLAGCSSSAKAPTSTSEEGKPDTVAQGGIPEGFKKLDSSDKTFSLAVPKEWTNLDEKDPDFAAKMKELDTRQPGTSAGLKAMINGQVPLMAMLIDEAGMKAGFATNVNVTVDSVAPTSDAQMQEMLDAGLKQFTGQVKGEIVDGLPGGKGMRVYGPMKVGDTEYEIDQYTLFMDGKSYHITVSFPVGKADGDLAKKITETFSTN